MAESLRGIFPILATCFHPNGEVDYDSQKRLIAFCVESGVHGLVALANASEGHLLSEDEKRSLLSFILKETRDTIPVIATVNHPSDFVVCQLAEFAQAEGAAAVMVLPPFFGRWRAGLGEISSFFASLNRSIHVPIILQDHVLSDIALSVEFITNLATDLEHLQYVKLESGNILHKARKLSEAAGPNLRGVFGGNSGIFLPEEWEAGCCGTMPACYMPDVFRKTWDLLDASKTSEAIEYFTPYSRLAAYEKEICNRCVWKELLVQRGIIACGAVREPKPSFADPWQINQLIQVASRVGLLDQ